MRPPLAMPEPAITIAPLLIELIAIDSRVLAVMCRLGRRNGEGRCRHTACAWASNSSWWRS